MPFSKKFITTPQQTKRPVRSLPFHGNSLLLIGLLLAGAGLSLQGCSDSKNDNANSNANSNRTAGANANSSTSGALRSFPKEPDPYSTSMTIAQEGQPPLQVEVGRMKGDRRWSFQLSGIGEVVYMEKTGLKYLLLPERKQYAELLPGNLAFSGADTLTPSAMAGKLGAARAEKVAREAINGVMAVKYRLAGSSEGGQADDLVYIDEGSGLPVRIEAGLKNLNGLAGRVVIDAQSIRLNPDAALFDVPVGTRKVDAGLLKPQVERLIESLKAMAALMGRK